MTEAVLQSLLDDSSHAIERLRELLSIPSISTDPAYVDGIVQASEWLADTLAHAGLDPEIRETGGHPVVFARTPENEIASNVPDVLFYGHYDVQPPDPLDLWDSGPFEPTVSDGDIVARGASDDKGQVMCFIEAVRAWKRTHGRIPVNVSVLIEGEEEMGSAHLPAFVKANKRDLRADIVLISDTTMWDKNTVAITYGLRGLVYFDLKLHGPSRDLHSGIFGGTVANPANILSGVLGRLFDEQYRVAIPGFYDDVIELGDDERAAWEDLGFEDLPYLKPVGVDTSYGECGYSTLERKWARPTCDINGLYGGYGGHGAKTIIPRFAGAKVSFRLVPNQDPKGIASAFEQWLYSHDVQGFHWDLSNHGEADPVLVSTDSSFMAAARRAIEQSSGHAPVLVREGGSIPVVSEFKNSLDVQSLLIGFGLADDCVHAPNEKFSLANFALGSRTYAMLLAELALLRD